MPQFFHVTPIENLSQILATGLTPAIGERSAQLGESVPAVYLFTSIEAVDDACMGWLERCFDDDAQLALLGVEVDDSVVPNAGVEYEAVVLQAIAPQALTLLSSDLMEEVDVPALASGSAQRAHAAPSF